MTTNTGTADRMLRIAVGLIAIAIALFGSDIPYSFLGWLGIVPVLTAVAGNCPLYTLLGISTCATAAKQ